MKKFCVGKLKFFAEISGETKCQLKFTCKRTFGSEYLRLFRVRQL